MRVARALRKTSSLRPMLRDDGWIDDMGLDAVALAGGDTGLDRLLFPDHCPWSLADAIRDGWMPA